LHFERTRLYPHQTELKKETAKFWMTATRQPFAARWTFSLFPDSLEPPHFGFVGVPNTRKAEKLFLLLSLPLI
jgi:hypothetical protein